MNLLVAMWSKFSFHNARARGMHYNSEINTGVYTYFVSAGFSLDCLAKYFVISIWESMGGNAYLHYLILITYTVVNN